MQRVMSVFDRLMVSNSKRRRPSSMESVPGALGRGSDLFIDLFRFTNSSQSRGSFLSTRISPSSRWHGLSTTSRVLADSSEVVGDTTIGQGVATSKKLDVCLPQEPTRGTTLPLSMLRSVSSPSGSNELTLRNKFFPVRNSSVFGGRSNVHWSLKTVPSNENEKSEKR